MDELRDRQPGEAVNYDIERDARYRYIVVDDVSCASGMMSAVELSLLSYRTKFNDRVFTIMDKVEGGATMGSPKSTTMIEVVEEATIRFTAQQALAAATVLAEIAIRLGGDPAELRQRIEVTPPTRTGAAAAPTAKAPRKRK